MGSTTVLAPSRERDYESAAQATAETEGGGASINHTTLKNPLPGSEEVIEMLKKLWHSISSAAFWKGEV